SFVGHDEQRCPRYLFEDVMSNISPRDGKDFSKPDSVNGDSKDSLSVARHPVDNTTRNKPRVQAGSSRSSSTTSGGSKNNNNNNKNASSANSNSNNANNSTGLSRAQ